MAATPFYNIPSMSIPLPNDEPGPSRRPLHSLQQRIWRCIDSLHKLIQSLFCNPRTSPDRLLAPHLVALP
jgi:hypothetical protein